MFSHQFEIVLGLPSGKEVSWSGLQPVDDRQSFLLSSSIFHELFFWMMKEYILLVHSCFFAFFSSLGMLNSIHIEFEFVLSIILRLSLQCLLLGYQETIHMEC